MQILKATKMKPIFPYHIKWGRFVFLVLLVANFQMIQAAYISEVHPNTETDSTSVIFISKEASISGLEYLYISHADAKNGENQPKIKKKSVIAKKLPKKKGNKHSQIRLKSNSTHRLSNTTKSDTFLYSSGIKMFYVFGTGSFSFKCIITDNSKTINFLIILLGIFLINFYKSRLLSRYYFSKNFQRPPPEFI